MRKRWSEEEVSILRENYSILTNEEIIHMLPERTYESITIKSGKLGLKKSKEVRSCLIAKRNKIVGRDLDFNTIKDIASKFKTRSQFQKLDSSAYVTARTNGWLNEVCSHMKPAFYSMPQMILYQIVSSIFKKNVLYNDRSAIKPLEIDVYVPDLKIGFEYNGKYWHRNEIKDKEKICSEKNIKLFTILENNRDYENDIKNQMVNMLDEINSYLGINIERKEILNIRIEYIINPVDFEDIKNICLKYNNFSEFSKKEPGILRKIKKLKLDDTLTSHMDRNKKKWTEEDLKIEISKFKFLSDLIKNNFKVYLICKRKYKKLLEPLEYKKGYEKRFLKKS